MPHESIVEDALPHAQREQTDESLRAEREKSDQALEDELGATDEIADAVISRARTRADKVLATTRAKSDRTSVVHPVPPPATLVRERLQEDHVLEEERATADETLREERAEHVALLSREREKTDQDLTRERTESDETLAARDEVLGIVSHDLRNMLNAMMGFASLIAKAVMQEDRVEPVLKYVQRIQRSGARMDRLIGDLIDVITIDAGTLAVTRELGDPLHVVTEAVETFQAHASASGVSLVAENGPPCRPVSFDAARILQVLTNLLSNAIKFTPANGRVVIGVEQTGDDIRFAVSDTGVGIPADQLDAVFVRFRQLTQRDRRGVGLGLYISKCIVEAHGGRIWAESWPGGGSTFYFTLPLHVGS